jgi:phospholipase/carboxylesterase
MPRALATDTTARIQVSHIKLTEPRAFHGLHPLGLRSERDAYLYVPKHYGAQKGTPLVVLLHGAGGNGQGTVSMLQEQADKAGFLILAPTSAKATWDFLIDDFGPDVALIERAISEVLSHYRTDPKHFAIGGFSDGASYALTLGLTNGDVFTHIIAFSPGFMMPPSRHGHPKIYISHGSDDRVLPIHSCSHRIVPNLEHSGYPIRYHEFQGPHTVPVSIASEATQWWLGP